MDCTVKNKIAIGSHNIECTGAIRESRYKETKTGKFDGVHLYGSSGRKAYTNSVLNILTEAKLTTPDYIYHLTCPQTQYRQHSWQKSPRPGSGSRQADISSRHNTQAGFNLRTENRFNSLIGKNQENC